MKNPARKKFEPLLSQYVDGELSPEERQQVEQHLAANKESADQVADFRAMSGLIRHATDLAADEIDWKEFSNGVMSRIVPEKLPLLERIKISLSEMFTWQRGPMLTGAALASAAAVVAVVVLTQGGRVGYAAPNMSLQAVTIDGDTALKVQPVVMQTKGGDSIIWVVEEPAAPEEKTDKPAVKKETGEDGEELGIDPVKPTEEKKAGEL
jgi:anti-sigma factor RsiW